MQWNPMQLQFVSISTYDIGRLHAAGSLVLEVFGACKMCLHGKSGRKTPRIDSRVLLFNFLASVALDVVMRAHRKWLISKIKLCLFALLLNPLLPSLSFFFSSQREIIAKHALKEGERERQKKRKREQDREINIEKEWKRERERVQRVKIISAS